MQVTLFNTNWNFDLRQEVLGRSAGYSRRFTAGMVLRWKSLTEPLFTSSDDDTKPEQTGTNNRGGEEIIAGTEDSTVTIVKQPPENLLHL